MGQLFKESTLHQGQQCPHPGQRRQLGDLYVKDKGCSPEDNNAHILDKGDNCLNIGTFFKDVDVHFPDKNVIGKLKVHGIKNTKVNILTKT